ncbi:putative torsin-1B-like isoform X1 [Apostichopus japonicus]|uniref:Putative torsin-1B-like isoform X1 n=1 Tax=Stichopus japonicus TaxID=307972 RepID=A0A2G8LAL0_STIJA|nr:putative torsin-1B-like isoform X1 [Apostichopus japonicus]
MDCPSVLELLRVIVVVFGLRLVNCTDSVFSDSEWNPYCWGFECCNEEWIVRDINELLSKLTSELFGQHLVHDVVFAAIKGHIDHQSEKPLVLSFHGTTGTGKNHVSQLIAKSWFLKGMESKFVHVYSGTKDFPYRSDQDIKRYKNRLQTEIKRETKNCKYSIFIFDEIDSFPAGLLNSIRSYLEHYPMVDGVDYRNTIFILLSNTGGNTLKDITFDFYRRGRDRKDIKLGETEKEMVIEVFNDKDTGFSRSRLIDTHLISHYIPFLPLERDHVRWCIRNEMIRRSMNPTQVDVIDEVLDELQFHGIDQMFSVKGCKNVAEKLSYVVTKRWMRDEL